MIRPSGKDKKLKDACRTCWIQCIDSYTVFLELVPALHTTLQAMVIPRQYEEVGTDWNWDGETITKVNGFLFQLQSSTFLYCFNILLEILHNLRRLTIKLHMQARYVVYAQVSSVSGFHIERNEREVFKRV